MTNKMLTIAAVVNHKHGKAQRVDRPLRVIAEEIQKEWKKVKYSAVPYLNAMKTLGSIHDDYYLDSGESIVRYFLSNASGWRGEKAREIKAELKRMLR